jgi:hypothetical protein
MKVSFAVALLAIRPFESRAQLAHAVERVGVLCAIGARLVVRDDAAVRRGPELTDRVGRVVRGGVTRAVPARGAERV